jgi:heat shock protein HspQ
VGEFDKTSKFAIGEIVRHRMFPFRGVVFDVDPEFNNTEEWYQSIPAEIRPRKDQPYYHLLAENAETTYIAYVSEQNLLPDGEHGPIRHPMVKQIFERIEGGRYQMRKGRAN